MIRIDQPKTPAFHFPASFKAFLKGGLPVKGLGEIPSRTAGVEEEGLGFGTFGALFFLFEGSFLLRTSGLGL